MTKHSSLPVVRTDSLNTVDGNYLFIYRSEAARRKDADYSSQFYYDDKPVCNLNAMGQSTDTIIAAYIAKHWPECVKDGKVYYRWHCWSGADKVYCVEVPTD